MKLMGSGVLVAGEPGTSRACYTFPSVVALSDGRLLATTRHGAGKDGEDDAVAVLIERDGAWVPYAPVPPAPVLDGRSGTLKLVYLTELSPRRLLAAVMWVDRTSFPGKPLFNAQTEGCLPMAILLARSDDGGLSWSQWQQADLPAELEPPSLTSPVFRTGNGRLAMSIETNKHYLDDGIWRQKAVLLSSADEGDSWTGRKVSAWDPEGRIFNWDLRVGVAPDGRLVSFAWMFDREARVYRNIHRRISHDHGQNWSAPEDLGIADQAGRPAILTDGRLVLAWVDRFGSRSIRARSANDIATPLWAESEILLYSLAHQATSSHSDTLGAALAEMELWSYGLPSATALGNGEVIVVYYAGDPACISIRWARLAL